MSFDGEQYCCCGGQQQSDSLNLFVFVEYFHSDVKWGPSEDDTNLLCDEFILPELYYSYHQTGKKLAEDEQPSSCQQ